MHRRTLLLGTAAVLAAPPARASAETLIVHRDPSCGCCGAWVEAFRKAGYRLTVSEIDDVTPIKVWLRVPETLYSCHTVEVAGYFLEGHVPLQAVSRLLEERPDIRGLAVAGMPAGSLGMGEDPNASYDVVAVPQGGRPSYVFQAVRPG